MGLYLVPVCYNARQDNIQYNTITQSHKITNTQDNPLYAKLQKEKN
jgi:hypothetical protein